MHSTFFTAKAFKVWFSYSHNCTLVSGAVSILSAKFDCPVAHQKFSLLATAHDCETGLHNSHCVWRKHVRNDKLPKCMPPPHRVLIPSTWPELACPANQHPKRTNQEKTHKPLRTSWIYQKIVCFVLCSRDLGVLRAQSLPKFLIIPVVLMYFVMLVTHSVNVHVNTRAKGNPVMRWQSYS